MRNVSAKWRKVKCLDIWNYRKRTRIKIIQNVFRVFQYSHLIDVTTWIDFITVGLSPFFDCRQNVVTVIDSSYAEQVEEQAIYLSLYGFLWSLSIQYKDGRALYSSVIGIFIDDKELGWLNELGNWNTLQLIKAYHQYAVGSRPAL